MAALNKRSTPPGVRWNAAWNCAGTFGDALIGLFMLPFVVHTLGATTYGVWALIASMTGCLGFLDLGVRGALGRQLAFHLARRDTERVNATFNTAMVLLCGACLITLLSVLVLQFLFFQLFDVPPDQEAMVRLTLLLAGLNLALSFPLSAFDAALWAGQRFDRLNQIDISAAVLKAALIFLFLKSPTTLICLPVITLAGLLLAGGLKMISARAAIPGVRIGAHYLSRTALGDIFSFGLWNFVGSVARQFMSRIPAIVIGAFIGPAAVTPYAIADKLLTAVNALFAAATGVLTPKSAGYSALDDSSRQKALFLHGGRLCWAMALFVALGMCFFGRPFIAAWLGPKHPQAAVYLAIIALGSIVPLAQSITLCVLLGVARHQFLAVIAFGQAVLGLGLSLAAATYGDAVTVCAALAIASTLGGVAVTWHGCRSLHVRFFDYACEAVAPAVAVCLVPAAAGAVMLFSAASLSPYAFIAQTGAYTLLFACPFYWLCLRSFGNPSQIVAQQSC